MDEMTTLQPFFTAKVRDAAATEWARQTDCDPARFGELSRWTQFVFQRAALRLFAT